MLKRFSLIRFLTVSFAFLPTVALATPSDTPAAFTPFFMPGFSSATAFYGASHAGYGYVGSSDTYADMEFNEACDPSHLQGAVADEAQTLATLRERVFEYLTYEVAALNPSMRPVPVKVPACVRPTSAGPLMLSILPRHSPTDSEVGASQNPTLVRLMKFRGVWAQTRPSAVIIAVVFDDLLKNREALECIDEPTLESACFDIKYARLRLKGTFPFLIGSSEADQARASIRHALILLIGTEAASQPGNVGADPSVLGTAAYLQNTSVKDSAQFQSSIEKAFHHAMQLSAPTALRQALKDLLAVGELLLKNRKSAMEAEIDGVCGLDLPGIASRYPNVIRQALVDVPAVQARTTRASICPIAEFRNQQRRVSCAGVSGGPLPGVAPVIVNRRNSEFPFANLNILSLTQPTPADSIQIHVKVHFSFDADIAPVEISQTLTRWQTAANAWYACQVGGDAGATSSFDNNYFGQTKLPVANTTCPAGYNMKRAVPIQFDIRYTVAVQSLPPDGPSVAVHRCYRTELKSSDCKLVRDFAVSKCQSRCDPSNQTCNQECTNKQLGDLENNRANSGNFILGQQLGTLLHETGHLMGLSDEYLDPELPFALIGRPGGIMTNVHGQSPRLDLTHIHGMLEPLECH